MTRKNVAFTALAVIATFIFSASALAGTTIHGLPCSIIASGHYVLAADASIGTEFPCAVMVMADDVTIDLSGHTITGPGANAAEIVHGIVVSGRRNVEVRNGFITGFSGDGIHADAGRHQERDIRAVNLTIAHNGGDGIDLRGRGHLIENVVTENNGLWGIVASRDVRVANCTASGNYKGIGLARGGHITASTASHNRAVGISGAMEVAISHNLVAENGLTGINAGRDCRVTHNTVSNNNRDMDAGQAGIRAASRTMLAHNRVLENFAADIALAGSGHTLTANQDSTTLAGRRIYLAQN